MAMVQRVAQNVRVVDEAGRPRPQVTIAVISAAGPVPEMAYVTGEDGNARIGLPPGKAELELFGDGDRQRFSIVASAEPGQTHELRLDQAAR